MRPLWNKQTALSGPSRLGRMQAMQPDIRITKLPLGRYQANCYILAPAGGDEAIVIDAPGAAGEILAALAGLRASLIVLTHTHLDHIEALPELRARLQVPVAAHADDAACVVPPPEKSLRHGDRVRLGGIILTVIHTPGHTPGSICLSYGNHLISGDTLFPGGPGKTGTPHDFRLIVDSITRRLFVLADATEVHPGHGPDTLLGKEKKEFAAFVSRPHPADICGDVVWLTS